jgi:hypothetical protein
MKGLGVGFIVEQTMEQIMDKKVPGSDMGAVSSDTVADEMKACVALAAGPARYGDTIEAMLWRAAQVLGFPQRRVRSLWYRSAKNISAIEYLLIKERANELLQRQARHAQNEIEIAALVGREGARGQRLGASPDRSPESSDTEA